MNILIAALSSSALAAVISGVFTLLSARQKKDNGIEAGVRILLYERIKYLGNHFVERGYVTRDEYEDLIKMHEVYHTALGGNGYLDNLMLEVNKLPHSKQEKGA